MRVHSVDELRQFLQSEGSERVEVEYHETDALPGDWGPMPETMLLMAARKLGYESVARYTKLRLEGQGEPSSHVHD